MLNHPRYAEYHAARIAASNAAGKEADMAAGPPSPARLSNYALWKGGFDRAWRDFPEFVAWCCLADNAAGASDGFR